MAARVLLVDDDRDLRVLLNELLQDAGFAVTAAEAPEQVPLLLETDTFDAIVCDQRLGAGQRGTALLDAAREKGQLAHTACVLISGLPPSEERPWLRVLQKPFDLTDLVSCLKAAVATVDAPDPNAAARAAVPARAERRTASRRLHQLNDDLLDTELDQPLRLRIGRALRTRQTRLSRTELALELGKATRAVAGC